VYLSVQPMRFSISGFLVWFPEWISNNFLQGIKHSKSRSRLLLKDIYPIKGEKQKTENRGAGRKTQTVYPEALNCHLFPCLPLFSLSLFLIFSSLSSLFSICFHAFSLSLVRSSSLPPLLSLWVCVLFEQDKFC